jgi:hypothetical protein
VEYGYSMYPLTLSRIATYTVCFFLIPLEIVKVI